MISISGMSGILALQLVNATEDKVLDLTAKEGQHARGIAHFRETIGSVETVDDLLADHELYSFVMKAYDLEDQIFGKAMIRKLLESEIDDDEALINKMTDKRFDSLYEGLGFTDGGTRNANVLSSDWQDGLVDLYVRRQMLNDYGDENAIVGTVLEMREAIGGVKSAYDILGDTKLIDFFQTVLGLPSEISALDVDRQSAILEEKLDIENLGDPEYIRSLEIRYVSLKEAESGAAVDNNAAVQLLSSSGGRSGRFNIVTLDIDAITASSGYRAR